MPARLLPIRAALLRLGLAALMGAVSSQCTSGPTPKQHADVVVSVKSQKLACYTKDGKRAKEYPISTSKFGLNDKPGTYGTPLGLCEVVAKIGHGAPAGAVFKSRQWTGEVIKPNSPGRDPIVSRIMWLRGLESINKNAYARCIYIHGTAEEVNIGKPVSYGCIRMTSKDVIDLFARLPIGARVLITQEDLPSTVPDLPPTSPLKPDERPPIYLNPQQQPAPPAPTPMLAQNTKPVAAPPPSVTPAPEAAPDQASTAVIKPKPLPGGGAVLYSAPTSRTTPGMVLKSRRTASQGLQN